MRSRSSGERGQAVIETFLVGLLLLAPLMWGLGVLADLHRSALAAAAAAREAGFDASRASDPASAARAIEVAVRGAFRDQGLESDDARVQWSLGGLERGAAVQIRVEYPVTVLQAPFLGKVAGPSILVRAAHVARVDPYRSRD